MLAATLAVALTGLVAAIASGELVQKGDVIVSFKGKVAPHSLPRDTLAPVSLQVEGAIKTEDGSPPPRLRQFSVALNSNGKIFTKGLPTCRPGQLVQTSTEEAMRNCGPALVGRGHFEAHVSFPTVAPFPATGVLLAFNGKVQGKPAMIMHVYGSKPVQTTFVLPLRIARGRKGTFGTILSAKFPSIAAESGYVTGVKFTIGRTYFYKGKKRSYLSASCAAPDGLPGAIFPFARGTFQFVNGQKLATTLTRDCLVRR